VIVATFGGYVALRQLRQQQKVVEAEIERGRARDGVLDGQLREIQDRERTRQREQAERVDLTWELSDPQLGRSLIVVKNGSARPLRDVTAVIHTAGNVPPSLPLNCDVMVFAGGWGMPPPNGGRETRITVLRPGEQAGYVMALAPGSITEAEARVQFTDDAGYRWQLTSDLSLSLLPETASK
jgi:hypothetical protein